MWIDDAAFGETSWSGTLCVTPVIHKRPLCTIFLILCYMRKPFVDCINRLHPLSSSSRVTHTCPGIDNPNDNRIDNPLMSSRTG